MILRSKNGIALQYGFVSQWDTRKLELWWAYDQASGLVVPCCTLW